MMRSPKSFAVVVRRRDGSLQVRERAMDVAGAGVGRWPFVRGVASLVESLRLGSEALRFSFDQMEKDFVQAPPAAPPLTGVLGALGLFLFAATTRDDAEDAGPSPGSRSGSRGATWLMLFIAIGFIVALPQALAAGIDRIFGWALPIQSPAFQALTGAFKLTIVVGYLLLIRRMPDIRRVFQYHGAEHKTISTYEAGDELTVANARLKTTLHARCGTTFIVMVALVSIAVFTAIGAALPRIHTGSALLDNVAFFFEKLPFLPLIAAATFELQRLLARTCSTGPLRILLWPGFLVQKITTAEPSDDQLEVALASLRVALMRQMGRAGADGDTAFAGYESLVNAGAAPAMPSA